MCSVLILLDKNGGVVGTLPYEEPPDSVLIDELGEFEFEAKAGDDYVYRLVE